MGADERYDVVIVGGGPNGTTTAAYLAKCGLSVCVLEERYEAGGSCETVEPIAGARIYPHAMLMYAAPAPGFEQLELWKYGFRMYWNPFDLMKANTLGMATSEGLVPYDEKDLLGFAKLSGLLSETPCITDLLRATFWCPPHPPEVEVTDETVPYMQVYKQHQPDMWTPELRDMTMFDLMDEHLGSEPFKVTLAFSAWASGAAAHWEGVAIPAFLAVILLLLPGRLSIPRGGLHGYFHSILRCAIDPRCGDPYMLPSGRDNHQNGRAVGVRLRDDAAVGEKTIWADKAVISGIDFKQTFNKLVGPQHLDRAFLQRINDISLKNGSLYVSTFHTRKPLQWRPKYKAFDEIAAGPNKIPHGSVFPADTRELYFENVADVDSYKGNPTLPPERLLWFLTPSQACDTQDCQHYHPKGHISAPFEVNFTAPEYHVDGPDAIDKEKEKWNAYIRQSIGLAIEGLEDENIIHHWSSTPREAEFRNTGLIGGTWCGRRHCDDQLWTQ